MVTKKPKRPPVVVEQNTGEIRKPVEAIAIQPQSGRLTLLTRKLFNTLLFYAQQQGKERESYRIALAELTKDTRFDSHNTEILKDQLRRMMSTRVEWNDPGRSWEATSLVTFVKMAKESDGQVYLEWGYSPTIKSRLVRPDVYTRLSLHFQTLLRSSISLALYEICVRYATNPSGVTMREPWEWWVPVLCGTPEKERDKSLEYKYFKRDSLNPAIVEINTLTDIEVTLIEHKEGRRVAMIQFAVAAKKQAALELGEQMIDMALLGRMMKLGLSRSAAQKLYTSHEEGRIRSALDLTEQRLSGNGKKVENPVAFFKSALREGWVPEGKEREAAEPVAKKQTSTDEIMMKLRDSYWSQVRSDARAMFNEQTDVAQDEALDSFAQEFIPTQPPPIVRSFRREGLSSKAVESLFFTWLAKRTWPTEPTERDLLEFGLEKGLLNPSN